MGAAILSTCAPSPSDPVALWDYMLCNDQPLDNSWCNIWDSELCLAAILSKICYALKRTMCHFTGI